MVKQAVDSEVIRVSARVRGVVQGVGFRPFVYRLAVSRGLIGFVHNDGRGVVLEFEGPHDSVVAALKALETEAPPAARVEAIEWVEVTATGGRTFEIADSADEARVETLVSPDIAICEDCLREMADPGDRRHRYPFINCTNCGPRFTIITGVPYDRPRTTMAGFAMCPDCAAEYGDPADRRFHAQPVACPVCGPRVELRGPGGESVPCEDPVSEVRLLLKAGSMVAVKGLGGYHMACDARNSNAVQVLRDRKTREDKPFALMAADIETVERFCEISGEERELLLSPKRPIVLFRKKGDELPEAIAPNNRYLGFMLPYSPLHRLLFGGGLDVLVMTSGNRADEPIAYWDEDAYEQLAGIADYFLTHDRPIYRRVDDSVTRVFRGGEMLIRRSRGCVPTPVPLPKEYGENALGCGAEVKNTFCVTKGDRAFVSHHIGDLINPAAVAAFEEGVEHFKELFDAEPTVVAYDMHPDYFATQYAEKLTGVSKVPVQHHHAHIAAVLGEHGFEGPVIGVAWDGAGYGPDGTVWGGEILLAERSSYERLGRFRRVPLAGGDAAVREPWRAALGYLTETFGFQSGTFDSILPGISGEIREAVVAMLDKRFNVVESSSAGRLFDCVASLLGFSGGVNYEGQAAVELEQRADPRETRHYPFTVTDGEPFEIDWRPAVAAVAEDIRAGTDRTVISARFHNTAARMVAAAAERAREITGLSSVALSGGVFQNITLLDRTLPLLERARFDVLLHKYLPPNDGCISYGQVVAALASL
ncbi:MAG: carbamoyltransferase HypF [Candidatus Coatesbacteria bacterium]|nr:MAG: carbamoyltransferase HypF [Candidatus Coatesbacteria bacterium]